MPIKTCLPNILSVRFDFGVPLEDVFPPNDIHPRLKYLFGKAFQSYVENGSNIEHILSHGQGTLSERLALKDQLVLSLDYSLDQEDFSPGAYFWAIRHFLGLLPLPVFAKYARGVRFDWEDLAQECKSSFKCSNRSEKDSLDYDIAHTINMLPMENVMLLGLVVQLIRKMAIKNNRRRYKFNRASLMAVTNYYCSSLFVRPFRPGCNQKTECYPLLLYLILRWSHVSRYCQAIGHPTYFLDSDLNDINFGSRNYGTQTNLSRNAFLSPEVITICKKIPFLVNFYDRYFKDIGCQTESDLTKTNLFSEANINTEEVEWLDPLKESNNKDAYKLAYIAELEEELENEDVLENDNTFYQTAPDFTFNSILDKEEKHDWKMVVKETIDTVKRVEESYIYDDYETFKKEEFNQIGKNRTGSFISRIGKAYSSSKMCPRKGVTKSSTPKNSSPESENSYVRYPDVLDSDDPEHSLNECEYIDDKNRDLEEIKITDQHIKDGTNKNRIPIAQRLFQGSSPSSVKGEDSREGLQDGHTKKKEHRRQLLKRLRMSLEFLRTMTPKKSTFKMIESKVKYRRIRNGKSHTI